MGWMIWGLNPGGGKIFRILTDRPWSQLRLLYNVYGVIPGCKAVKRL
jgi:hypothetical protein